MRRIQSALLAAVAAIGFTSIASAADMPVKARPAPIPAVYNWTGFYIGAQIGWSQINDSQALSSPTFALTVTDSANGFLGGAHAGYNFQSGQFVYGIEADFEGNSTNNTYAIGAPFVNTTGTVRLNWQGSVRGRLGVAADRVLFYGTGGWAFGRFTDSYTTAGTAFNESVSSIRNGWTLGAGLEYAFLNNFTARAEYRYTDWGTHTNNLNVFLAPPGISANRVTENAIRIGVSYKF